jgi:hypothetical protein
MSVFKANLFPVLIVLDEKSARLLDIKYEN